MLGGLSGVGLCPNTGVLFVSPELATEVALEYNALSVVMACFEARLLHLSVAEQDPP